MSSLPAQRDHWLVALAATVLAATLVVPWFAGRSETALMLALGEAAATQSPLLAAATLAVWFAWRSSFAALAPAAG